MYLFRRQSNRVIKNLSSSYGGKRKSFVYKRVFIAYNHLQYASTNVSQRNQTVNQTKRVFNVEDREQLRLQVEWLGQQLGVQKIEDWYSISSKEVLRFFEDPSHFKQYFNNSLYDLLRSAYVDYNWQPWKFSDTPSRNFWNDIENQREYFDWLGKELGVQKMEDWYQQTTSTIMVTLISVSILSVCCRLNMAKRYLRHMACHSMKP